MIQVYEAERSTQPRWGKGSETNDAFIAAVAELAPRLFYIQAITDNLAVNWQDAFGPQVDVYHRVFNAIDELRRRRNAAVAAELGVRAGAAFRELKVSGQTLRDVKIIATGDPGWVEFSGRPKGGRKFRHYYIDDVGSFAAPGPEHIKIEAESSVTPAQGRLVLSPS